jgi:hypothetical protein
MISKKKTPLPLKKEAKEERAEKMSKKAKELIRFRRGRSTEMC